MSRRIITRRLGDYTDAIFPPVTDIAALREQAVNDIVDKTVVYVDDEGLYVYSSSSVLADDGIAVIAPTVGGGRWLCVTRTGVGILGSDWWPSVISATNVVPGAPADGDRYLVTAVAPGLWAGQEEKAAEWNSSSSEWVFYTPTAGTVVYVAATTDYVAYNNAHPAGAWVAVESVLSHALLADLTTGDPHTQYQQESEKGAALGYASLDGAGQVVEPPAGGKLLTGLSAGGAFRRIGNGTTNIAGAATVTLGTFTRNANEQLFPTMWVQQDVATLGFGYDRAAIGTEGISLFFDRTLNANEFRVRAINNNVTTARDVEWAIYGIVP